MSFFPRACFVLLVILLAIGTLLPLSAQDSRPRIGVLRIENQTGQAQYESLADTIRQTVVLTLTLLDRYDVTDENMPVAADPAQQADALPADTLLWGGVEIDEQGRIVIALTIFDRLEERVVLSEEGTAPSLLDVFDTADTLVGEVIGAFSGVRVGFGTIRLDVSGQGDYLVFLDGTQVGENVTTLDRILTGEYRVRVEQDLPGGYRTIVDEELTLQENTQVTVAVPLMDAEDLRLQELAALMAELEEALLAPPGPGPALEELSATLASYSTFDPDPVQAEWYATRVDLEAEYRDILDHSYFAESRPTFDRDLPRSLLATTYQLHENPPSDRFSPEQLQVLREASRRNVNTFFGVMMLAADYQTILGNVDDQTLPYDILFDLNQEGLTIHGSGGPSHYPHYERIAAGGMARNYAGAVERQRPLWHNILIGAGAVGVTTAGLIFGTGMPGDRIDDGDATYDRYRATTDPAEAVRLREETEDYYDEANRLFLIGGTAGLLGVTAITTGVVARVRSVRRPQRILEGYLEEIGEARLDAAISFFEEGEEDRLVLVRRTTAVITGGRQLQLGDGPAIAENGPAVYRDLPLGEEILWTSTLAPYTREHIFHGGRNVMYVP
ncbi:MAG: hypothetical protein EA427_00665 [Spirochaetaceae bacterium]|nr:MAG: hypothetical protein EA427_00665 [Spirochaetaceae bacterium]